MKIYAYIAAAMILGAAAWYFVSIKDKADRMEAAETALAVEKARAAALATQTAQRIANAENRSQALAAKLSANQTALDELRNQIPKQVIRYVHDGKPAALAPDCALPRLDSEFVRVWNSAADASAVHPTH